MKKIKFLSDMKKQGKLDLVEPSNEMQVSYFEKADSHLESSKILLKTDKLEESISLAYFAMYPSLMALFFIYGIKSENHSTSIIILKEIFNEKELYDELSFAKKERIDKQYYIDFKITLEEVKEMIKNAEIFINKIKMKIRAISNKQIDEIRKNLMETII